MDAILTSYMGRKVVVGDKTYYPNWMAIVNNEALFFFTKEQATEYFSALDLSCSFME